MLQFFLIIIALKIYLDAASNRSLKKIAICLTQHCDSITELKLTAVEQCSKIVNVFLRKQRLVSSNHIYN